MNHYLSRNYDNHHDTIPDFSRPAESFEKEIAIQRSSISSCTGISHAVIDIPTDDGTIKRTISDVEMAFSGDPSVASNFSDQTRLALQNRIFVTKHGKGNVSVPSSFGRELSDVVNLSKRQLDNYRFFSEISSEPTPEPTSEPTPEPTPANS